MTKYIAFIEFELSGNVSEAEEEVYMALRHHGLDVISLDVGLPDKVQLTEPVLIADNLPDDPFQFPHIKQLMEALTLRGDRYAD